MLFCTRTGNLTERLANQTSLAAVVLDLKAWPALPIQTRSTCALYASFDSVITVACHDVGREIPLADPALAGDLVVSFDGLANLSMEAFSCVVGRNLRRLSVFISYLSLTLSE